MVLRGGEKELASSYLGVFLAVVGGRAVLWSSRAVGVSLCCLVMVVPLLHGFLQHVNTSRQEGESTDSRSVFVLQCFLPLSFIKYSFLPPAVPFPPPGPFYTVI